MSDTDKKALLDRLIKLDEYEQKLNQERAQILLDLEPAICRFGVGDKLSNQERHTEKNGAVIRRALVIYAGKVTEEYDVQLFNNDGQRSSRPLARINHRNMDAWKLEEKAE